MNFGVGIQNQSNDQIFHDNSTTILELEKKTKAICQQRLMTINVEAKKCLLMQ